MRKRIQTVKCPTRELNLVAFDIDPNGKDMARVNRLLVKAEQHGASAHSPSGRIRDREELIKKRYLGFLSEDLIAEYLQSEFGPGTQVSNSAFESHDNHVDIEIHTGGKTIDVEVRSSFLYAPLQSIVCRLHDVIGPYSTERKLGESPKDFYLRALINVAVDEFNLKSEHTLFFAAGAPKDWFFSDKARRDDMKQQGADYLLVPMIHAMDAVEVISAIRRHASGV